VDEFGSAVVNGIIFGSAYALLALGIVLIYKGSRVFNFAQGEFATVAAFVVIMTHSEPATLPVVQWTLPKLPYPIAAVVGVVVAIGMGLLVERFIVQPLFTAPRVTLLVATAGVALGAIALELFFGDAQPRFYPPLVDGTAFQIFGLAVTWQHLLIVGALAVLSLLLYLFFSRTHLGLAVLAASQDATATNLVGVSARRISALVWGMAALLGGVAGVLVAAQAAGAFTPGYFTSQFLIFSFVAAVVGGMTSLPGAVLGGMILGLVQQFSIVYVDQVEAINTTVPGTAQIAVFLLLVIVLAIKPTGLLGKEA
jgi:branched-chain amino acid transport system permease protein